MTKQLKDIEDKRLMGANVYLNLYVSTLEEFVDSDGDIHLAEFNDNLDRIFILKEELICFVEPNFWDYFSDFFKLNDNEIRLLISKWVENTYNLNGINTYILFKERPLQNFDKSK